ncbi:MAG: hypothetical protein PSU94_18265 [Lacunisphaera sp.]|nr:hypothetical protein [Lacunisphaera sp.]
MPTLKEAAVVVTGQIIDIERLSNFETKAYDGLRVVIATGDGFAQVKLSIEDSELARPAAGTSVAWLVRYGAWAREGSGNANTSCRFVRVVEEEFLGRTQAIIKSIPKAA